MQELAGQSMSVSFNYQDAVIDGIVGKSTKILSVLKRIQKVASSTSTVLVTGESGTGKELIAQAIHSNSPRCNAPIVVINCGAIPGELLESELFGHEKGAFTGAHRARMGRLEMANGGTVFLDEIGDMSPDLQVKLLRAVQEQCFERVGSTSSTKVDIRIISATNKDLKLSVGKGKFREDLFYRLNVIPIHVPPLRERTVDIPLLVSYFIDRLSERNGQEKKKVSEEAVACLMAYSWPGNIRELENLMERLLVLVDDDLIVVGDLPGYIQDGKTLRNKDFAGDILEEGLGFNEAVERHQKSLIIEALNRTNWVKAKAAELLQINRTTLVEKIKKMKIEQQEIAEYG
ncbi:MAG: RNA polymerase subunit sigma-54 [Desulfobacteraceae bacterium 4572_19]|nr:MAG: RNA polymerase subunit sigma-54 [Desulfobacteraceae bacterium 4572_19]